MRAITLWQPWASAIALGHKKIETRSRRTHVRGQLAIHAAKRWTAGQKEFAQVEKACGRLAARIPLGAVVAVADLVDCKPVEEIATGAIERIYGDYESGRFGWLLDNIRPLSEPVGCKGGQGFWFLPPDVEEAVKANM